MNATSLRMVQAGAAPDWFAVAQQLGRDFGERAAAADEGDCFVAGNFEALKQSGLASAGVPREFGGGGATHADLCEVVRELGRHCGSTALAFSMHTHQVAVAAWRWRHQKAPVEGLLKRVADERVMLVSSGGSDWLHGSGVATRVEGGFTINARKIFASGAPAGDLLLTSAVYDDPEQGPTVLHFAVPLRAEGVRIDSNWRALGMRGTGSNDIVLDNVFIADSGISGKRPQGKWHMLFHIISMIAIPLIYSAYLGVAESARDIALGLAAKRAGEPQTLDAIGRMETGLGAARLGLADMIAAGATNEPGFATTNRVFIGRALVVGAVLQAVELAMEVAGGTGFYRVAGLERRFRDAQAARFHPLRDTPQRLLAARLALGLDPDGLQATA